MLRLRNVFGIAIAWTLTTVPVSAETLRDALTAAYNHSGLLAQNRALLRAADEDVAIATAALKPVVSWSASYRFSHSSAQPASTNTVAASVDVSYLLYDFGRTALGIDIAKESVLATRQGLVSIEQDVLLRAVAAYMNYRRSLEFVRLSEANVRLLEKELSAAKDRFDVGEVTRTDVALAESRLALTKSTLAGVQGDKARAAAEYRAAIGHSPKAISSVGKLPSVPGSVQEAIGIARQTHPAMRRAQHGVKAAELAVTAAGLSKKPTVRLGAGVGLADQSATGVDIGATANLSLSAGGTLYQGGALGAQKRQAIARRDAERNNLHVLRHAVDQAVTNAYSIAQDRKAISLANKERIRAAEIAFTGLKEEASLGARTLLDVLDAEQELLDARVTQISFDIDQQISAFEILSSMGMLTVDRLNLPVKKYDPTKYYNLVKSAPSASSEQGKALDRVLKGLNLN